MKFEPILVTSRRGRKPRASSRRAAAAVELVLTLPMLCFICLMSIDFSRLFFAWATIADCTRDGALYATNSTFATSTTYTSLQQAALANATNLTPTPTVSSTNGTDGSGNSYVQVTVTYQFSTLANYPGIPTSTTLTRTLRMNVAPP